MSDFELLLVVLRLLVGCWLLVRPRWLPPAAGLPERVSVVIPARDEAANLPALLASLPDGIEVVVVDDHSSDGTAEVAAAGGARVVVAPALPDGWCGKPWACATGAAAATGDVLVFVDADVRFGPHGLERVLAERSGLVSVQPSHVPGAPVEQLAGICNVVAVAGADLASPLAPRGAFGPVLATTRADYDAVGGHDVVAGEVVEDVALAGAYRAAGSPVAVRAGGEAVSFRMYPHGWAELRDGFARNLGAGAAVARPLTLALVVAWVTLLVQAALAPALMPVSGLDLREALGLYAVVAVQVGWALRRVGRFAWWTAPAFPLLVAAFLWLFVRSVVAGRRGEVSWRGRTLPIRR